MWLGCLSGCVCWSRLSECTCLSYMSGCIFLWCLSGCIWQNVSVPRVYGAVYVFRVYQDVPLYRVYQDMPLYSVYRYQGKPMNHDNTLLFPYCWHIHTLTVTHTHLSTLIYFIWNECLKYLGCYRVVGHQNNNW